MRRQMLILATIFCLAMLTSNALAITPLFETKVDYPAGTQPRSVISADFDNDGYNDLAVLNSYDYDISVLLNNGDGTFAAPVDYSIGGATPYSICSADLNIDGYNDLVVANNYSENLGILFNDGDGTFAPAITIALSDNPTSVKAADLNGDGSADIIASISGDADDVAVLINIVDGSGWEIDYYDAADGTFDLCTGDFNQDGHLDIASANSYGNPYDVSVFINDGDGSFAAAVQYTAGSYGSLAHSICSADLNGDNWPDLAVANAGGDDVSILINDGDGTFGAATDFSVGNYPNCIFSADLDLDGDIDLAVTNYEDHSVSVLLNNGDGIYASAINFGVGSYPEAVFAADLDDDEDFDLAVANDQTHNVSVLLNRSSILLYTYPCPYQTDVYAYGFPIAHFKPEIVLDGSTVNNSSFIVHTSQTGLKPGTVDYLSSPPDFNFIAFTKQSDFLPGEVVTVTITDDILPLDAKRGENGFGLPHVWQFGIQPWETGKGIFRNTTDYYSMTPKSIVSADFDGDRNLDIAVTNDNTDLVSIYINNGDGTFITPAGTYGTGDRPIGLACADFNADGAIDLAVAHISDDFISILINNGDGTFQPSADYAAGGSNNIIYSTDIDGDGDFDLVSGNTGIVRTLKNNGDGTFLPADECYNGFINSIATADCDLDGDFDILVSSTDLIETEWLDVLSNDGFGSFTPAERIVLNQLTPAMVLADFNGDYKLDLATGGLGDNILIYINAGNFSFLPGVGYNIGTWPSSIYALDVDGDGYLDLASRNIGESEIYINKNNGDGTFQSVKTYSTDGDGVWAMCSADLDGDHDLDLATVNSGNSISILLNLGYTCGDIDGQEGINILDVVFMINYIYKDGTAPDPLEAANVNYGSSPDSQINILDVVCMINFIYKDGADLSCP